MATHTTLVRRLEGPGKTTQPPRHDAQCSMERDHPIAPPPDLPKPKGHARGRAGIPAGMRGVYWGPVTGGVASLNYRLHARMPPASILPQRPASRCDPHDPDASPKPPRPAPGRIPERIPEGCQMGAGG